MHKNAKRRETPKRKRRQQQRRRLCYRSKVAVNVGSGVRCRRLRRLPMAKSTAAARLVSCSAVVRRVGRVLWISFAHLTLLRARAESFDLLLVCVCVCVLCLQLLLLLFVNYTNYVQ